MNELGTAIRAWRERLTPADVGLPAGPRRRVAGLRRDELGQLAGISVEYVVRLEQGRVGSPSYAVVAALARALRLDDAERERLHLLAGQAVRGADRVPTHIPPGVQRLVDQLVATPVAVLSGSMDLLTWNPLWAALHGEPAVGDNTARAHFLGAPTRVRHTPEQTREFSAGLVGDLHTMAARHPDDPELAALVAELRAGSEEFARLWHQPPVRSGSMPSKTIEHPELGPMLLDCDVLTAAGTDLRIVAYTAAPGTEGAEQLRLLQVLGTQQLTP